MNLRRIYSGIKERLPGGRVYNQRKIAPGDDEFLRMYHKYYNDVFFLGRRNVKVDSHVLEEDYFEFAGLSFPMPKSVNDFKTLMGEASDLLFPYKFRNSRFDYAKIEKYFDEGPYEISNDVSLQKGDIVIDCGANMGLFSNIALSKECDVYAFEPSKSMQNKYLRKYKNERLHIEQYALSDHMDEEIEFVEDIYNVGGSYISGIAHEGSGYQNRKSKGIENVRCYKVKTITLDDWVKINNISRVDFIKADIEGSERFMLRGGVNVLHDFSPKLSICTYHFKDDPIVLENIIRQANPDYIIEHKYKKLYAYVPNK